MPPLIRKIEPGDVIGRCRIIRELGRGGVGTVYLATHQTLQIEVALKILSPSLSIENPALAERFIREAQLAARIRHPNVIAVMDAAQDETTGLYFIVMEYVSGGSLSWHLRHGPLPEAKALAIVTGIANALLIAEENQIVHRDIKPDNIMLDLRGTPKLADLGLAKQAIDSHTSLTLGGSYMGTPAYMSPEQARDAKIADTRDDIYSLGASFYECLTGEPPFQGETPYNIMSELLTKPSPQPRAHRPEISRSADLICRKMMAKTRSLRYADARALLDDLHICQTCGESGLSRLEAATFAKDSIQAQKQALSYGVETTADGVALIPDLPDDSEPGAIKPGGALRGRRGDDRAVFTAAALLVAVVTVATFVLAWEGGHHPFSFLTGPAAVSKSPASPSASPALASPAAAPVNPVPAPASPVVEQPPPVAPPVNPPVDLTPPVPGSSPEKHPQPVVAPVPPPFAPSSNATNAVAAVPAVMPMNPAMPGGPTPAAPAVPDSAFAARNIAESTLGGSIISPTGRAELLKIIGKRDETQATPTTWIFYFYDKSAVGRALIVTVTDGKVVKSGEDLVDIASPYDEQLVMPEDKLLTDSSQVLQILQGQMPGVTVTGSEFLLSQQKNSVPMWKVTLWSKDQDEDHKLGDATILAENGEIISKRLKP